MSSYIFVIIVLILIGAITFAQTSKMLYRNITAVNNSLVQQMKNSIDNEISRIINLSDQIVLNQTARKLVASENVFSNEHKLELYEFKTFLTQTKSINNFVDEVYIYINNQDAAIGTFGVVKGRQLYDYIH